VVAVPKKGAPVWIIVLVIIAVTALPCFGILAAIAIPNFLKYQQRAKQTEAKINLRAIATAEKAYFGEHDAFVAAGPVPAGVPAGAPQVFTPDQGFKALGWQAEGPVRFQYIVTLDGPKSATGVARGDLSGNGKISEFKVSITPEGMPLVQETGSD
jgi:type II secretory pathway pseudopilin PulG